MEDWKEDIKKFIIGFADGIDITRLSSFDILREYYLSKGITEEASTNEWLFGLAEQKYPPYTIAMKYIKEIRKQNTIWRRDERSFKH